MQRVAWVKKIRARERRGRRGGDLLRVTLAVTVVSASARRSRGEGCRSNGQRVRGAA